MSMKRKPAMTLARPTMKASAKMSTKPRVDESTAAVSTAASSQPTGEPIEISSDSSSDYDDPSDAEEPASEGEETGRGEGAAPPRKNNHESATPSQQKPTREVAADADADADMRQDHASDSDDEATPPTFGDLLRGAIAMTPTSGGMVAVPGAAPLTQQQQASAGAGRAVAPPALSSLGTVLNQALRTDDAVLLESCLQTTDLASVRATIQRMDSALAGTLLAKLAARMHRRPARAHSLMAWVQWTLVAHGGALAGQQGLVRRLAELSRVLEERARALPSLLALKGKLDMLEAQMVLRRDNLGGGARGAADEEGEGSDGEGGAGAAGEEEGVVYVEGEEGEGAGLANGLGDDEVVLANGIAGETDDESEDDSLDGFDDADEGSDEEAESLDESEVDFDDAEELGDEEDETDTEVGGPPAKVQKVGGARASRK